MVLGHEGGHGVQLMVLQTRLQHCDIYLHSLCGLVLQFSLILFNGVYSI